MASHDGSWSMVVKKGSEKQSDKQSEEPCTAKLTTDQQRLVDTMRTSLKSFQCFDLNELGRLLEACGVSAVSFYDLATNTDTPRLPRHSLMNLILAVFSAINVEDKYDNVIIYVLVNKLEPPLNGPIDAPEAFINWAKRNKFDVSQVKKVAATTIKQASSASDKSSTGPTSPFGQAKRTIRTWKVLGVSVHINDCKVQAHFKQRQDGETVGLKTSETAVLESNSNTKFPNVMGFLRNAAAQICKLAEDEKTSTFQNTHLGIMKGFGDKTWSVGVWPVFFNVEIDGVKYLLPLCMTKFAYHAEEIAELLESRQYTEAIQLMAATSFSQAERTPGGESTVCKLGNACHNSTCTSLHASAAKSPTASEASSASESPNGSGMQTDQVRKDSKYPATAWIRSMLPRACGEIPPFKELCEVKPAAGRSKYPTSIEATQFGFCIRRIVTTEFVTIPCA